MQENVDVFLFADVTLGCFFVVCLEFIIDRLFCSFIITILEFVIMRVGIRVCGLHLVRWVNVSRLSVSALVLDFGRPLAITVRPGPQVRKEWQSTWPWWLMNRSSSLATNQNFSTESGVPKISEKAIRVETTLHQIHQCNVLLCLLKCVYKSMPGSCFAWENFSSVATRCE